MNAGTLISSTLSCTLRGLALVAVAGAPACDHPPSENGEPPAVPAAAAPAAAIPAVTDAPDESGPEPVTKTPAKETADPAIAAAQALLGNDLAADPRRAADLLEATFGNAPGDPTAALLLARAAFRSEQTARCRVALDALFAHVTPEQGEWIAEGSCLRGWLAERAGRYAEAIALYRQALATVPGYAFGHYRLGVVLLETGEHTGAIASLERATELNPALAEAHFQLAHALRRSGRAEDAGRELAIHRELNRLTDNTARTPEAMEAKYAAYERLETILPDWLEGRVQLTRIQVARGMGEQALARLRKLVHERPDCADAWLLLPELLRNLRGDDAARREIGELLAELSGIPEATRPALEKVVKEGFGR